MANSISVPYITYDSKEDLGTIFYLAGAGIPLVECPIQFQHEPVGKNGVNGVQNEDVLKLLALRLRGFNSSFPCRENSLAITHIETALLWLEHRTRIREEQGVEGKREAHVS